MNPNSMRASREKHDVRFGTVQSNRRTTCRKVPDEGCKARRSIAARARQLFAIPTSYAQPCELRPMYAYGC